MIILAIIVKIFVVALLVVLLASPIAAFVGGALIWRMHQRHRIFPHMAMVKFGMAAGITALLISEADPSKPGFQLHLVGWHGFWFVSGLVAIVLPLYGLVGFLLGLKNGDRKGGTQ